VAKGCTNKAHSQRWNEPFCNEGKNHRNVKLDVNAMESDGQGPDACKEDETHVAKRHLNLGTNMFPCMAIRGYSILGFLFWSSNIDWVVGMVDRARANFKLCLEVALQLHSAYIAFSGFSLCDGCLLGENTR
jgi:hypothetical protein